MIMSRKFIVCTSQMSQEEEQSFARALTKPIEWWHKMPNTWIIIDPQEVHSTFGIRAIIQAINPKINCISFDITDDASGAFRLPESSIEWFEKQFETAFVEDDSTEAEDEATARPL